MPNPEHYEALKGQKIRVKLIRPNADGVREFSNGRRVVKELGKLTP